MIYPVKSGNIFDWGVLDAPRNVMPLGAPFLLPLPLTTNDSKALMTAKQKFAIPILKLEISYPTSTSHIPNSLAPYVFPAAYPLLNCSLGPTSVSPEDDSALPGQEHAPVTGRSAPELDARRSRR